jgi:hypothetical protein
VSEADLEAGREALDCYVTYRPVVEAHQPLRSVEDGVSFELFGERHEPSLSSLLNELPSSDPSSFAPPAPSTE